MGHEHDWLEPVRRRVVPRVGSLFALLEDLLGKKLYHSSEQRRRQFVGRVRMDEESFEQFLHDAGYERNPLAWLKQNTEREIEEGSWRHCRDEMQTHLILYDGENAPNAQSGELFLYAHDEYRWDVHPWKHLTGERVDADTGVRRVKKMLEESGIDYDYIQPG